MITEKNNVFYCDCGFSFQRGRSGAHDCAEGLRIKLAESEARCAALAAENAGMNAFVDALLSIAWQGCSADGAEIQELALKHGLLRQEVYSADEHETLVDDPGNFEDGDPVYFRVETQTTDAFLAEVRAHDLNAFIRHHSAELDAHIKNGGEQFDEKSVRIRDIIVSARLFREQIRKEAAQ